MVPEPALSFTIPSLHDGISLDCRVYHPASLAATEVQAGPWKKHAAVVAHPYAPMGGCYDDPVLGSITARLLAAGYLVGTFNFRGAGHSAGRSSWTARPERDDYASMVGFTAHYVHFLDPFPQSVQPADKEDADTEAATSLTATAEDTSTMTKKKKKKKKTVCSCSFSETMEPPLLVMGGYSYGAMVTTQLPPVDELLAPFLSPEANSEAAQIRLRAENLAEQQNLMLGSMRAAMLQVRNPRSPTRQHSGGVRIGGEEGTRSPRKSHDGSHCHGRGRISLDSEDRTGRGMHDLMGKGKCQHSSHHWNWALRRSRSVSSSAELRDGKPCWEQSASEATTTTAAAEAAAAASGVSPEKHPKDDQQPQPERLPAVPHFVSPRPAYILISPLQGLVSQLATMSFLSPRNHGRDDQAEKKLVENPTMAVFGDNDVFVPVSKLRAWTTKLSRTSRSRFTAWEVPRAGHFWTEEGVLRDMNERVGVFAGSLV
ncbi:hypothetical protein E4U43_006515 [Claviceps pusilla]|uniref:Prolyl oligopeptidase n=1 Tax=Claviceps pusilla TaxID=123648 RepID=A0A9P7NDQ6_9HYPO|nr:hypothetical protein E4U43_006515 [Claviceps pusilla]